MTDRCPVCDRPKAAGICSPPNECRFHHAGVRTSECDGDMVRAIARLREDNAKLTKERDLWQQQAERQEATWKKVLAKLTKERDMLADGVIPRSLLVSLDRHRQSIERERDAAMWAHAKSDVATNISSAAAEESPRLVATFLGKLYPKHAERLIAERSGG